MEYYGDKVARTAHSLTERSKVDSTHVEQKPTRVAFRAGDNGCCRLLEPSSTPSYKTEVCMFADTQLLRPTHAPTLYGPQRHLRTLAASKYGLEAFMSAPEKRVLEWSEHGEQSLIFD